MENRFVHGGNVYCEGAPEGGWRDFSANINPLGLASSVRTAVADSIDDIIHYPDPSGKALKEALSDFYGVPADYFVLGNGAAELFYVLFHTEHPKKVLLPIPSFSEYERAALAAGADVVYHTLKEEEDFVLSVDSVELEGIDCILLGNPNNPTGNMLKSAELEKLIKKAGLTGTIVAVDESFLDFREDEDAYSVRSLTAKYDNLIILRSLTKFYALPGLRLGFAVTNPNRAEKMDMGKDPWNVNLPAQRAGVAALKDTEYQKKSQKLVAEECARFAGELRTISGFKVFEPTVNFILIHLGEEWESSAAFCARMREKGFLLRDCSNYPGLDNMFVRVAVKTKEENEELLAALRSL
ncbi:MAG: threonine-phosphate decarboxylase CobD [Schwartzia sp.]|nr:threonine-phosphate decarboxylase CobD [Schwartzia sp. (in: firmicutes)]